MANGHLLCGYLRYSNTTADIIDTPGSIYFAMSGTVKSTMTEHTITIVQPI